MQFLKFIKQHPTFLWLIPAVAALMVGYTIDNDYSLAASATYLLFILLFMRGMKISTVESRRELEQSSCDFINTVLSHDGGKVSYFVPCKHEEKIAHFSARLFNKQYLRVYEANYTDSDFKHSAFLIVLVNQKQLFEMKLRGMIDTNNREHAVLAQKYLGIEWPMP